MRREKDERMSLVIGGKIKMAEGGGGEAMNTLLRDCVFRNLPATSTPAGVGLEATDDGAAIWMDGRWLVFTTDSYVVQPIFFRGGDIGKLAVTGTINDLAVMGARPLALSLAIVLSEGFEKADLERIMKSVGTAAMEVGVPIVTGDTKVIQTKEVGILINTSGIGIAEKLIRDSGALPGDSILINGAVGEHGVAIMSQREGISFETAVESDCHELWSLVRELQEAGIKLHAAKDPTRGGIASALNEMASKSGRTFHVQEELIPIRGAVRGACEMLGLDPFEIANEGKVILCVPPYCEARALEILKRHDTLAAVIGHVTEESGGEVIMETIIGGRRVLRRPLGDPIPRVC